MTLMDYFMAAEVSVALITLAGVVFSSVMAYLGHKRASKLRGVVDEVSDAVNNRHPTQPRLFDAVLDQSNKIGKLALLAEKNEQGIAKLQETIEDHISEHGRADGDKSDQATHRETST